LTMGGHLSLPVREKGTIVDILRLSDVFGEICPQIKACRV
jgi:hypothetical protein